MDERTGFRDTGMKGGRDEEMEAWKHGSKKASDKQERASPNESPPPFFFVPRCPLGPCMPRLHLAPTNSSCSLSKGASIYDPQFTALPLRVHHVLH